MKLGLALGYWGAGPPPGVAEQVAAAEELGFDSMWSAEAYGSDALTPLAWFGSRTSRMRLGTSVLQISARTPTATAMAAMTLDHLSGGRPARGAGAGGGPGGRAALARNPVLVVVPCHRVVGAGGRLTGYAGGLAAKRTLLDLERGVVALPA